jgi:hypothetical protein
MAKGLKTGGRTKGTPNKTTAVIRVLFTHLMDGGMDKFEAEFNSLSGYQYVDAVLRMSKIVSENSKFKDVALTKAIETFETKIKNHETNQ